MSLTRIKRPITSCNKPVIKLVTTTECKDNIADNYYGSGTAIDSSSSNAPTFPFVKITNLRGFIKDVPREITRQDSLNCRTQKVFSKVSYRLQGGDFYPSWKMRELEEMFHAKQIIMDGQEIKFPTQTAFEEVGTFCNPVYRLRALLDECRKQQIYGCQSECEPNCYHFLVPSNIVTQNFFNEAGQQVASTYSQLLEWYRSQSNITEVVDVKNVQIQCDFYKIFKVVGTGYVPSFLFYDSPTQSNKIFGKALDCANPNYSTLCGNVDNRACGELQINPVLVYELLCEDVEITGVETFIIGESCNVQPFPSWVQHTGATHITSGGNVRTLNVSVFNDTYIGTGSTEGVASYTTPEGELTCSYSTGIPPNANVYDVQFGGVVIPTSDYSYNPSNQVITFMPCVEGGIEIRISYTVAGTSPTFNNEIIAIITGSSCLPPTTLYLSNANNPSIPLGSTLVIDTLGNIKWIGAPSSSDMTGTVIEVTNIIYTV